MESVAGIKWNGWSGSSGIRTEEEFEKILTTFPDSPELNKAFADFLAQHNDEIFASHEYCRASILFLKTGRPIQALGAKIHAWKLIRPTEEDKYCFSDSFKDGKLVDDFLGNCLKKINFSVLDHLIETAELITVPADETIIKDNDKEDAFYCIMSGEMNVVPTGKKIGHKFVANNVFGQVYPLDEAKRANYSVTSLTRSELLKVPKSSIQTVCQKYPEVENVIKQLYQKADSISREAKRVMRKATRHQLTTNMVIEIFPNAIGRSPVQYKAYSGDISLGGMCIFVDPKKHRKFPPANMEGRIAKVLVTLPDETITLGILGKIAWCKEALINGKTTGAIGMEFDEMPPSLRGQLVIFANAIGRSCKEEFS